MFFNKINELGTKSAIHLVAGGTQKVSRQPKYMLKFLFKVRIDHYKKQTGVLFIFSF